MKNVLFIFIFTIAVTLFYWYVGQLVPQKETYPPKTLEIRSNLTTEEMVEIGEEIAVGKGTCLSCHTIGSDQAGRFPDLANIGAVAATRKAGLSDIQYLAESIYEPDSYVVEGFNSGMPKINKPPINLNDREILTVIAFLQALGGKPTVTMQTKLKWQVSAPASPDTPVSSQQSLATTSVKSETIDGKGLFNRYACITCHSIDDPTKLVGPSLYDVGSRLNKASLYEAILEPDASIAQGYTAGIMPATLEAIGFYDKVTMKEIKVLVDYLATQKGGNK
jgi:cytochrome c2